MKRYLTTIFILITMITIMIGYSIDVRWNGIVAWSLAIIFLIFAAYFTKFIPEKKKKADKSKHAD